MTFRIVYSFIYMFIICINLSNSYTETEGVFGYAYPKHNSINSLESHWNTLITSLQYNEEFNSNKNILESLLNQDEIIEILDLLTSRELMNNKKFLTIFGEKLVKKLESINIDDDNSGEFKDGEDLNNLATNEPTDQTIEINENCSLEFTRLLAPITNKIGWNVYNVLCNINKIIPSKFCTKVWRIIVRNQFEVVNFSDWGISMLDFFGKPGPSITQLNIHWVGDYDACKAVEGIYETGVGESKKNNTVIGNYCRLGINRRELNLPLGLNLFWGMCLPKTCSEEDVMQYLMTGDIIIESVLEMLNLEVRSAFCGHELEFTNDTDAIIAVVVVIIIISIVLCATIYDCLLRHHIYTKKMPREAKELHNNDVTDSIPDIQTQISTVSSGSKSKLFQTQLSVSSNNTHLSDIIHQHDTQESISCCQRLEIILVSFSAYSNIKFIFRDKRPVGWLHSVDGFRVLSAIWVVFGYSFILGTLYAESVTTVNGIMKTIQWLKTVWYQMVINFHLAGETFLLLNGCIVTYWWMKTCAKNGNKITTMMMLRFYIHRYWRLIPTTLVVILIYSSLYQYLTEGPINPPLIEDAENCKDNWWLSLFMLQNVIKTDQQCLSWSWIVAVSFQMHLISPLVLIPLVKKPLVGFLVWLLMLIAYVVISIIVIPDAMPGGFQGLAILGLYYDVLQAPWTRAIGYIIGIAVGYILYKTDCKLNMPKIVSILGWLIASVMLLFPLFITHEQFNNGLWNESETTLYLIGSKISWSVGVGYMVIACETKNGSGIGKFLAWGPWRGLAPVIFIMMLTTPILIFKNVYSKRQTMYLEVTQIVYHWTGNVFLIFCVALIVSIAVEHPLRNITRAWFFETKDQAIMAGHHRKEEKEN